MVVLTIVTKKNGDTIYFEDPIPKVHFMKLISCSLYNSWDNLKKIGSATLDKSTSSSGVSSRTLPGHYNLESLAKEIKGWFGKYNYPLDTEINQPVGQLVVKNFGLKQVELDRDLADLLGTVRKLTTITFVKQIKAPTTYFIHCDLLDNKQNLFNGKSSDLLARFDVNEKPYEKVSYHSSQQQVLRDCATDALINSITFSVKDEKGELFDFKDFPLEFELELN